MIKRLDAEEVGKLALKNPVKQDRGFKVLKLNKSNFRQWLSFASEAKPEQLVKQLSFHIDHVGHKATKEDLLYEILIKAGFNPTAKVQTVTLAGIPVFSIADGGLLICIADAVTKELINAVAKAEPMQFICLDKAFGGNDQLKANAVQTFMPTTWTKRIITRLNLERYEGITWKTTTTCLLLHQIDFSCMSWKTEKSALK